MPHRPVLLVALLPVIALTACASQSAKIETGWEWKVNQEIAYLTDQEFDSLTGEITSGGGLQLPDDDADADAVREEAIDGICEDFIDDGYGKQSVVSGVLRFTRNSAPEPETSQEFQDAREDIGTQIDAVASLDNVPPIVDGQTNPAWDRITNRRDELADELWTSDYSELLDERDAFQEDLQQLWASIYNEDQVRAVQDLIIDKCGIEVPADYEYPTAADLDITLYSTDD